MPSDASAKTTQKHNAVLYLDAELVEKTKELGFNVSKTFENHLKQLITQFSNINTQNNGEKTVTGSPGEVRTLVKHT
jgi:post-segregation antitoxin (ccd killing protein)